MLHLYARQVEAAEALSVGFSVFYPSSLARVRLLQDIVNITTKRCSVPATNTQEHGGNKENCRRSHAKSQRPRLTSKVDSILMQVAVEGLCRECYAADLVAEALSGKAMADKIDHNQPMKETLEVGTGAWKTDDNFKASDLDAAMISLLLFCVNDLKERLWGTKGTLQSLKGPCVQPDSVAKRRALKAETAKCPHSRLLLVLQAHVVAASGDGDGDAARASAARELSLGHATRLLKESLEIFTKMLDEINRTGSGARGSGHYNKTYPYMNAVKNSFVALVPLLCGSLASLPMVAEGRVHRAAALLPLVIPLLGAVDCFNRLNTSGTAAPSHDSLLPPTSWRNGPTSKRWMTGLEETLAMLSADLACGLIVMDAITSPRLASFHFQDSCGDNDSDGNRKYDRNEDMVDVLLSCSPFLAHGRAMLDRPSLEDDNFSQPNTPDLAAALEVNPLTLNDKLVSQQPTVPRLVICDIHIEVNWRCWQTSNNRKKEN